MTSEALASRQLSKSAVQVEGISMHDGAQGHENLSKIKQPILKDPHSHHTVHVGAL